MEVMLHFLVASCNQKSEFCVCVVIVFERVLVGAGTTHGTSSWVSSHGIECVHTGGSKPEDLFCVS